MHDTSVSAYGLAQRPRARARSPRDPQLRTAWLGPTPRRGATPSGPARRPGLILLCGRGYRTGSNARSRSCGGAQKRAWSSNGRLGSMTRTYLIREECEGVSSPTSFPGQLPKASARRRGANHCSRWVSRSAAHARAVAEYFSSSSASFSRACAASAPRLQQARPQHGDGNTVQMQTYRAFGQAGRGQPTHTHPTVPPTVLPAVGGAHVWLLMVMLSSISL